MTVYVNSVEVEIVVGVTDDVMATDFVCVIVVVAARVPVTSGVGVAFTPNVAVSDDPALMSACVTVYVEL